MAQVTGKVYILKNGTFKAYKRGTSWYYVDKRGIEKRCGKHKCLKDDILLTPLSSENKAIAKEFVDSLTLHDQWGEEASDLPWTWNPKIDMMATWQAIIEKWERNVYQDVTVDLDDVDTRIMSGNNQGYVICSILVPPEDCSPEDRDQFFDELQSKFNDMRSTLRDCVRFGSDY